MAKRRAEPLMCHVPVKRLLREPALPRAGERRSRAEPASAGPAAHKRPLEEAEAPPGKRLGSGAPRSQPGDAGGGRRQRGGTAAPQDALAAEGRAGGRGKERAAAAEVKEVLSSFTGPSSAPRHEMYGKQPVLNLRLCSASWSPARRWKLAEQEEEEFCQYNSFLYWRTPLPAIDLSDIQNLDEETPSGAKTSARTDTTETEMET